MEEQVSQAKDVLEKAITLYRKSKSISDYKDTILHMHAGLDFAFRAFLLSSAEVPLEIKVELRNKGEVNYPTLVNYVRDYTSLLNVGIEPHLLTSLNKSRIKIAHPNIDPLSDNKIKNDARRLYETINQLWPRLFEVGFKPINGDEYGTQAPVFPGSTYPASRSYPPEQESKPSNKNCVITAIVLFIFISLLLCLFVLVWLYSEPLINALGL